MPTRAPSKPSTANAPWFTTTRWSVVLAARDGDTAASARALEELCRTYWPPIYAFLRREGHAPADAEDLTQAFFAHLLERDFLNHLHHREGKFRSFLLTFLKHFLSDQRDKAGAVKRGGGQTLISLDHMVEEERAGADPLERWTPEQAFEWRWAQALMERGLERLREEYAARGQAALFEALKDIQPGERGARSYADIGAQRGLSEQAVKSAVRHLRRRHQQILREEIGRTVGRREDIDEEIRYLIRVLGD
jgi:RNA polymerase sigma-70 factor (ECF subfamily)